MAGGRGRAAFWASNLPGGDERMTGTRPGLSLEALPSLNLLPLPVCSGAGMAHPESSRVLGCTPLCRVLMAIHTHKTPAEVPVPQQEQNTHRITEL